VPFRGIQAGLVAGTVQLLTTGLSVIHTHVT